MDVPIDPSDIPSDIPSDLMGTSADPQVVLGIDPGIDGLGPGPGALRFLPLLHRRGVQIALQLQAVAVPCLATTVGTTEVRPRWERWAARNQQLKMGIQGLKTLV